MARRFRANQAQDFTIVEDNSGKEVVVGVVRIKPNAILWRPRGSKGPTPYYGVPLDMFADFAKKNGTPQKM